MDCDGLLVSGSGGLKVVHVAKHCGYGNGNVHVAVDLACVQAQAGYQVWFVSGGGTFVPMLEQHGVRHILVRQEIGRPLSLLRSIGAFSALCRSIRPAVIHAHMTAGAVLGYVASRASGARLVTTVHNSFDPQSVVMRLGDRIVAVSHAERNQLIEKGYQRDRVKVVINASNRSPREGFMHNDREIRLQGPCVTMICGLHRRKGVFDAIEAFSSLAEEFPDWRLYIAGEGPAREELEAQVRECRMDERIIFLGFVPAPKSVFDQLDIFVLASYADPGSLSIGEARSAGCAIIATGVGGTSEMLDHGAAGRLVRPGAPEQIAAELRRLMQDPAARAQLQAAARTGSESFNVELLVGRYEAVYREALSLRRARPAAALSAVGGATQ